MFTETDCYLSAIRTRKHGAQVFRTTVNIRMLAKRRQEVQTRAETDDPRTVETFREIRRQLRNERGSVFEWFCASHTRGDVCECGFACGRVVKNSYVGDDIRRAG